VLGNTLYGAFGVYESIQLWNGVIFHLDAHLARLLDSAHQINLPLAGDLDAHAQWIHALIQAEGRATGQPVTQATIRLFAVGPDRTPEGNQPPRSFIWLLPIAAPDAQSYAAGVSAVTSPGERAMPNAKSLNTLVNTLARQKATAVGADEGLLVDAAGHVHEGASSNFYVIQQGVLVLPPPEDILDGVTLQNVLRLAGEEGIPVERRRLPLAQRHTWDEAFLTSTSRHILPLVSLDGEAIGTGVPGPITQQLHRAFERYFEQVTGAGYVG
jgi:branched-subunit amino acid aminotransferase/4-amino-4-deoxychorismate lyase